MSDKIARIILFIVGVINLLPAIVFFAPSQAARLYGTTFDGGSLNILMRHRAVLLGLIGAALIFAALKPAAKIPAIAFALTSKVAFIFLVLTAASFTAQIRQVALIDAAAIVLLIAVLIIHFWRKR